MISKNQNKLSLVICNEKFASVLHHVNTEWYSIVCLSASVVSSVATFCFGGFSGRGYFPLPGNECESSRSAPPVMETFSCLLCVNLILLCYCTGVRTVWSLTSALEGYLCVSLCDLVTDKHLQPLNFLKIELHSVSHHTGPVTTMGRKPSVLLLMWLLLLLLLLVVVVVVQGHAVPLYPS